MLLSWFVSGHCAELNPNSDVLLKLHMYETHTFSGFVHFKSQEHTYACNAFLASTQTTVTCAGFHADMQPRAPTYCSEEADVGHINMENLHSGLSDKL